MWIYEFSFWFLPDWSTRCDSALDGCFRPMRDGELLPLLYWKFSSLNVLPLQFILMMNKCSRVWASISPLDMTIRLMWTHLKSASTAASYPLFMCAGEWACSPDLFALNFIFFLHLKQSFRLWKYCWVLLDYTWIFRDSHWYEWWLPDLELYGKKWVCYIFRLVCILG